jgi:hypothetical protein
MLKLVNLIDVNHYEMFLMEDGAKQVAQLIYGENHGDSK